MPSRDPSKRALNTQIAQMTATLKSLQPHMMRRMGSASLSSLHAILGGKNATFIHDLKTRVLRSPDDYYTDWLAGLVCYIERQRPGSNRYLFLADLMSTDAMVEQYVEVFIKRTFLRQADDLSKKRPTDSEAAVWLGQNHASYGLLVTPRFNPHNSDWETDNSEIRRFRLPYFTISHILQTGLVIPGKNKRMFFKDQAEYLQFFEHSLVRIAGSKHQDAIAERYVDYVKQANNPEAVPLLLPEVRFSRSESHRYRLDFMVVEPSMMKRIGFELSPWSTHGRLVRTGGMTQRQLNEIASANREAELQKLKAYFVEHGIETIVFTDKDLVDPDHVFSTIARYLQPPASRKLQHAEVMAQLKRHT